MSCLKSFYRHGGRVLPGSLTDGGMNRMSWTMQKNRVCL